MQELDSFRSPTLTSAADVTDAPQNMMNVVERRTGSSFFAVVVGNLLAAGRVRQCRIR
jgi:hypothetical protein